MYNLRMENESLQSTNKSIREKWAHHDILVSISRAHEEQVQEQQAENDKLITLNFSMQSDIDEKLNFITVLISNRSYYSRLRTKLN